jgi:hypothetical protein
LIRQFPLLLEVKEHLDRDWRNDEILLRCQRELLALGVAHAILGRVDEIANVPFPSSEHALSPYRTRLWERVVLGRPMPAVYVPVQGLSLARNENHCLLAVAALAALPADERSAMRDQILQKCHPSVVQQIDLVEGLYWCRGDVDETDFPALAALLAESLLRPDAALSLLVWALEFADARNLDFSSLMRRTLADIDEDLFGQAEAPRLADGKETSTAEPGRIEIRSVLHGTGGPIRSALALVMRRVSATIGAYLARLLTGDLDPKKVEGIRSTSDLRRKLFAKSRRIEVCLQLEGDISIAQEDLAPYRRRLELSMQWLRIHYPELAAPVRLTIVP